MRKIAVAFGITALLFAAGCGGGEEAEMETGEEMEPAGEMMEEVTPDTAMMIDTTMVDEAGMEEGMEGGG